MKDCFSTTYHSYKINNLVKQLNDQAVKDNKSKVRMIRHKHKVHRSCMELTKDTMEDRQMFNHLTKQGTYFDDQLQQMPYVFIPKYKNDNLVLPDRALQKGDAAKRFHIKMKDTSTSSFKDPENEKMCDFLQRKKKDLIISGLKMEELNMLLDQDNGKKRAKNLTDYQKSQKVFNLTRPSYGLFTKFDPMTEPQGPNLMHLKKTELGRTLDPDTWKSATRFNTLTRGTHCSTFCKSSETMTIVSYR